MDAYNRITRLKAYRSVSLAYEEHRTRNRQVRKQQVSGHE